MAPSSTVTSGRAAPNANGATRRCCARSNGVTRAAAQGSGAGGCGGVRALPREVARYRFGASWARTPARCCAQLEGVGVRLRCSNANCSPVRVNEYQPSMIDALVASGEVAWFGAGRSGKDDGSLCRAPRNARNVRAGVADDGAATSSWRSCGVAGPRRPVLRRPCCRARAPHADVLEAVWELVGMARLRMTRLHRCGLSHGRNAPAGPPRAAAR